MNESIYINNFYNLLQILSKNYIEYIFYNLYHKKPVAGMPERQNNQMTSYQEVH